MRRSFIVGITGVMAYVILVAGLIVFPASNNIINNVIFDRSNQIAHATINSLTDNDLANKSGFCMETGSGLSFIECSIT